VTEPSEITVDARGHRCPTPTLRLRRALERAAPGAVVTVLADDPLARIDIPHFAAEGAHTLLDIKVEAGVITARVRKGGALDI
jgi:tRNA 2-thiouridine synthesizing protein A